MRGEMTRNARLVGCVTVMIAAGSCGSRGMSIGVDAGQADGPMATVADGASGDTVRDGADVSQGQADGPMATVADGASGDTVRDGADVSQGQADAPMARATDGADGGHVTPVAVSAGLFSTCALLSNGTVRCWGYNRYGQLGNATTTDSTTPVVVQGLNDAVALSASDGYHACAVRVDGTAQCWGANLYGDLGDGTTVDSSSIKTVLDLRNIATISTGGNDTCAALVDGTAYCWGDAPGPGTRPLPLKGVVSIQAGEGDICALLIDGTVDCWGDNSSGQVGNGAGADALYPVSTPTPVQGLNHVVAVSAGTAGECAVLADRTAACWGANNHGQLGNGTVTSGPPYGSSTPVAVSDLTNVVAITTAGYYACALLSDGSVSCWGDNEDGTLGNGTTTDSALPVAVPGLTHIVAISAGIEHACALAADGTIWCWGLNLNGELGHAPTNDSCKGAVCSMTPVKVDWSTDSDGGLHSTFPPAHDAAQESLPDRPRTARRTRASREAIAALMPTVDPAASARPRRPARSAYVRARPFAIPLIPMPLAGIAAVTATSVTHPRTLAWRTAIALATTRAISICRARPGPAPGVRASPERSRSYTVCWTRPTRARASVSSLHCYICSTVPSI